MKKRIFILCILVVLAATMLCGCNVLTLGRNTVGKDNTSIQKMMPILSQTLSKKGYDHQRLYGIHMSLNEEKIGDIMLSYADGKPQELQYKDILLVQIDSRTGEIKHMGEPTYEKHGKIPYDFVSGAKPIDVSGWKLDSDAAIATAAASFVGEGGFDYNYIRLSAYAKQDVEVYEITFISLIQHKEYKCAVDVYTGTVLSQEITES